MMQLYLRPILSQRLQYSCLAQNPKMKLSRADLHNIFPLVDRCRVRSDLARTDDSGFYLQNI